MGGMLVTVPAAWLKATTKRGRCAPTAIIFAWHP